MVMEAAELAAPESRVKSNSQYGKLTPGGRLGGDLGWPLVGIKPADCAVSTAQVPPEMTARPAPLPVVWFGAEQFAFVPPPDPLHDHVQGESAVTALAVPVVQRPAVGVKAVATPLALPQAPLTVATAVVVTLNTPLTPPMVNAAVVSVLKLPDEVCCTVTVSPLFTVPAAAV